MAKRGMTVAQANKAASTLGGMKGAVFTLTGDDELIKTLNLMRDSIARKVIKKGLGKAMRIMAKSMKAQVPTNLKAMKLSIGSRLGAVKKEQFTAKAGAAVGKASKAEIKNRSKDRGKKRGVGISGRNVHWFILGTGQRTVEKTGKSTGAMPAIAENVIKQGFTSAASQAADAIRQEIAAELANPPRVR